MFSKKFIIKVIGVLLMLESLFLFVSALVAYYYEESDTKSIAISGLITLLAGFICFITTQKSRIGVYRREVYIIVTLNWIILSVFGSIPYLLCGYIDNFTDAFFEAISGFTTTGVTVLSNIESLNHGVMFWRASTQWMGGISIIILSLSVLPFLNIRGIQLCSSELSGIAGAKFKPKLKDTIIRLSIIYILLTAIETLLLEVAGMSIFDAICHSFSTISTGGFSTKNSNIAHFNSPNIEYTITAFMFISGINFTVLYFMSTLKFARFTQNEELFFYIIVTLLTSLIIFLSFTDIPQTIETNIRTALFHTVSLISTTGYISSDFGIWPVFAINLVYLLIFIGGMTGSAAGGIKIMRAHAILKIIYTEIQRIIHPRAVIPLRLNGKAIQPDIVGNILIFVIVYILTLAIGTTALTVFGLDFETSVKISLSSVSNTGPVISNLSLPVNYSQIPDTVKWTMTILMLMGRLEIFTVLALFLPHFWKS